MMLNINKYNVNLSIHQRLGWTAGHIAAVYGDTEKAELLLQMGFNPDKGDKFGWTARQLSEDIYGVDIFKGETCNGSAAPELMNGLDLKMTDAHIAAIGGKPIHVLGCLCKNHKSFYEKDVFGYTPLDYLDMLHGDRNIYQHIINIRQELGEISC